MADLVVLDGALTSDPSSIHKPTIVFKDGIGFDAAELIASVSKRGPETAAIEVTVSPEILRRYVGEYELPKGRVLRATLEGERLMSQVRGRRQVELVAENETRFFVRDMVSVRFEFDLAADGTAGGVTVYQGGAEAYARKLRQPIPGTRERALLL